VEARTTRISLPPLVPSISHSWSLRPFREETVSLDLVFPRDTCGGGPVHKVIQGIHSRLWTCLPRIGRLLYPEGLNSKQGDFTHWNAHRAP
jgi:hypothetical protein